MHFRCHGSLRGAVVGAIGALPSRKRRSARHTLVHTRSSFHTLVLPHMSKPTSNGNAKKKQRTTGPSSGLAPGGANLLDSLLGGMNRTMARLPTKPMSQAQRQAEQAEAGMHYGMYKPPPQKDGNPNVCRNPDCGGCEFEIDWRQGDRICQSCGAVQNSRSVENRDAEYRIFQDDEKSANKERASVISGRGGGSVGQANVARAHALANNNAAKQEGENGLTDKDHKRITDYQEKVVSLGEHLNLTQNIIDQARLSLCEKLVIAQNIHEEGKRACSLGGVVEGSSLQQHSAHRHRPMLCTAMRLLTTAALHCVLQGGSPARIRRG